MSGSPVIIDFNSGKIFGILRGLNPTNNKIIICCPAMSGTRIGPQRIFVEIAQKLLENQIASFCVDIPPLGDSFDTNKNKYQGTNAEKLTQHYSIYLEIIIDYLKKTYDFKEFILLAISDGSLPIYNYARSSNEIQRIILLSPNHRLDNIQMINKKNFKQYYYKLLKTETWIKLFAFKLNLKKRIGNIYKKKNSKEKMVQQTEVYLHSKAFKKLLVIFGEKELKLNECIDFWDKEQKENLFESYSYKIVKGADHSFFGWEFKRDVETYITDWFLC